MSADRRSLIQKCNCFSSCFEPRDSENEADSSLERHPLTREITSILPKSEAENYDEKVSIESSDDIEFAYNTNNAHRGLALIFNQMKFKDGHSTRTGTNKDRDDLNAVLTNLNFEVLVFENLTTSNIFQELQRVAGFNHIDSDCLLITVMTHGARDSLQSYDGAYALKEMTQMFNDENCPSLRGKPRLFFIQACRGSRMDSGFNVTDLPSRSIVKKGVKSDATATHLFSRKFEREYVHNQPVFNDFLIVHSTMIDFASFRNPEKGSWFIQDLCEQLREKGTSCDILSLLVYVNWAVALRETFMPDREAKKVTLVTSSRLMKVLQFHDKNSSMKMVEPALEVMVEPEVVQPEPEPEEVFKLEISSWELMPEQTTIEETIFEESLLYNMSNQRRGKAVIFNQASFRDFKYKYRSGTANDADRLEAILKNLGFQVIQHDDLGKDEIFEELNKLKDEDHSNSDCLLITFLTHGNDIGLMSYDKCFSLRDVTRLFNDENCPTLKGKPRLFFIQACRGEEEDVGHNLNKIKRKRIQRSEPETIIDKSIDDSHPLKEFVHNQPAFDDFLIVHASMYGHTSYRLTNTGTWFIQDLCKVLEKKVGKCDILELMTFVTWSVSERESNPDNLSGPGKKSTVCTTSRLLKKIIWFKN